MERRIDFSHQRHMLCGGCDHRFVVGLDWIDRWEQGGEKCLGCDLTGEHEDAPRVTVDPDDPALDDGRVAQFFWYHTSTQPDWPSRAFDPASGFTPEMRMRMGGVERFAAWAARQRAKALHVGTYEAAVHNMLRRMHDQADDGCQFYLYRVHLKPSVVVRKGWLIDPSDFVGDVVLGEVCPPGTDVARYLNYHEAPGGLSLALGRGAIDKVQQIAIPLSDAWDRDWACESVAALEKASEALVPATGDLGRFMPPCSPRADLGRDLGRELAADLPINLQSQLVSAVAFGEGADPVRWAKQASCLLSLIVDPSPVLVMLDQQERREV